MLLDQEKFPHLWDSDNWEIPTLTMTKPILWPGTWILSRFTDHDKLAVELNRNCNQNNLAFDLLWGLKSDDHKTILWSGMLVFNSHYSQGLLSNGHWSLTMVNLHLNLIWSKKPLKEQHLLTY